VRFKIFTLVTILIIFGGLSHCVDWLVEANISSPPLIWCLLGVFSLVHLSFCLTCLDWPLHLRLSLLQPYIYGPSQSCFITSALKMETACFTKTLASTNQSAWWLNPTKHNQNCHCHEDLLSHMVNLYGEKLLHIIKELEFLHTKRVKLLLSLSFLLRFRDQSKVPQFLQLDPTSNRRQLTRSTAPASLCSRNVAISLGTSWKWSLGHALRAMYWIVWHPLGAGRLYCFQKKAPRYPQTVKPGSV
jgi:hypothetical protein